MTRREALLAVPQGLLAFAAVALAIFCTGVLVLLMAPYLVVTLVSPKTGQRMLAPLVYLTSDLWDWALYAWNRDLEGGR